MPYPSGYGIQHGRDPYRSTSGQLRLVRNPMSGQVQVHRNQHFGSLGSLGALGAKQKANILVTYECGDWVAYPKEMGVTEADVAPLCPRHGKHKVDKIIPFDDQKEVVPIIEQMRKKLEWFENKSTFSAASGPTSQLSVAPVEIPMVGSSLDGGIPWWVWAVGGLAVVGGVGYYVSRRR